MWKQTLSSKHNDYFNHVSRLYVTGRQGNGIGMKIIGGKSAPGNPDVGAYVAAIYKGGVADQLHGEVNEGKI